MEKDYFVPFADYGEDKFEEKRSKFTGRLWHVETAEEAVAKIKEMRETYWDATHNCYAYILREGNVMRYSDDGEPQGTAGMPILEVLRHENLTDCVCVVTRYFGGIADRDAARRSGGRAQSGACRSHGRAGLRRGHGDPIHGSACQVNIGLQGSQNSEKIFVKKRGFSDFVSYNYYVTDSPRLRRRYI